MQHFDASSSNWKKQKEKKKDKKIQFTTFRNICNITKFFAKLTSTAKLIINAKLNLTNNETSKLLNLRFYLNL